jgi:hypothetical protein
MDIMDPINFEQELSGFVKNMTLSFLGRQRICEISREPKLS